MCEQNRQYAEEVRSRFGDTAAYAESRVKTAGYTREQWVAASAGLDTVFAAFAECIRGGESAQGAVAQQLVEQLQAHITTHFYHCTKEILAGLGQMYVCDERFKNTIDQHGTGTAQFVAAAIAAYCHK